MALKFRLIDLSAEPGLLDALARLRITVFRDWPYLYDGDLDYERNYLMPYVDSEAAVIVGAFDGEALVGAATGTPMEDHAEDFASAAAKIGVPLNDIFYCAESVLLPDYRGQGAGHAFFDLRENSARALGRTHSLFCAVTRPRDHPARPKDYRPLDDFWSKRGYRPVDDAVAYFDWKDVGDDAMTTKPLQIWMRKL